MNRLRYAYEKAGKQIRDCAAYRKRHYDKRRLHPEIRIGDCVYVRSRAVHGRNKIQGTWDSTVYRVVKATENTVIVEPNDGDGIPITLNRQHVIKCRPKSDKNELSQGDASDSDSDDNQKIPTRRSTRVNTGKHSNPNKLPCTVYRT